MRTIEVNHRSFQGDKPTDKDSVIEAALAILKKHKIVVGEIKDCEGIITIEVEAFYLYDLVASYPWEMVDGILSISITKEIEISFRVK